MTFETKLAGVMLVAALSGCDQGSVGEFESDDGGASSGASSSEGESSDSAGTASAGSATGNASDTATSTSGGSETGESGESSGTSGGSSSSGGVVAACEGSEAHLCSSPVECGESCGELDSMFDASGCLRQACETHANCGDGNFCYRPQDYGGCQSSHVGCFEDSDGTCQCGTLPDCGGAYCVSEDIVFGGADLGPADGWASDDCAPDDGPAFVLRVGTYTSNACGGQFAEEPLLEFHVRHPLGSTGSWTPYDDGFFAVTYFPDGVTAEPIQWAVLSVADAADGLLTGEYAVTLQDDTVLYGSYAAVSCPDDMLICG